MNKLPQVLQNEIWEYVRGDRAFWKDYFDLTLMFFDSRGRNEVRKVRSKGSTMTFQPCDDYYATLSRTSKGWKITEANFRSKKWMKSTHMSCEPDYRVAVTEFVCVIDYVMTDLTDDDTTFDP